MSATDPSPRKLNPFYPVLDHGFVRIVEHWGDGDAVEAEAGIIEAARQSTQGSFRGWEQDQRLLAHLYNNKHSTPFEFAGMVLEVKAPIMVFREWHRHRCVAGDTRIHFNQKRKDGRISLHKDTIESLFRKFHQSRNRTGFPIEGMALRSLADNGKEVTTTTITNVFQSGEKKVYRITLANGSRIKTTKDHRFQTPLGWFTLEEIMDNQLDVLASGTSRNLDISLPVQYKAPEEWRAIATHPRGFLISSHGRVFNPLTKRVRRLTIQPDGYIRFTDSRNRYSRYVHVLVCEAFHGPKPAAGYEVSHKDHNRANNHPSNLEWVDHQENCFKSGVVDRNSRLCVTPERIVSCIPLKKRVMTYDLSVSSPLQNFIAEGFVIHNSQSYNEMSARYAPVPNEHYVPSLERVMMNSGGSNKQAGTIKDAEPLTKASAKAWRENLITDYMMMNTDYEEALRIGIPKELARLNMPVGRYSQMRACCNLRNWLGFLTLRLDPLAQWEIRQYAEAVLKIVLEVFPQTGKLFVDSQPNDRACKFCGEITTLALGIRADRSPVAVCADCCKSLDTAKVFHRPNPA